VHGGGHGKSATQTIGAGIVKKTRTMLNATRPCSDCYLQTYRPSKAFIASDQWLQIGLQRQTRGS